MAINSVIKNVYELSVSNDQRENIYKSIGFDLADKFDSKTKALIRKANLFDTAKKIKITLKYHEAWALQMILMEVLPTISNTYQNTLITKVIHFIDERISWA